MSTIFTPRVKPGVQVEQLITAAAATPVTPTMPSVVVGPMVLVQDSTDVSGKYTGSAQAFMFPSFEAGAKVKTDTIGIELSAITVALLGQDETLQGTVDAVTLGDPHAKRFLSAPTKTGIMIGVRAGDLVEVTENIIDGSAGVVDVTDLNTLSEAGAFTAVQPGDVITVTDGVTTVVANVTAVAAAGASVTTDSVLPAGTGLTWSVTRLIEAVVKSVPTGTKIELDKELSKSGSDVNTFVVKRVLVEGSTNVSDQPLSTGKVTLTSSDYTLATTSTTNDSFLLDANLAVNGFNSFNQYPFVVLSGLQLEVDTVTDTLKNQTGATTPLVFANVLRVGDKVVIGVTTYTVISINTSLNTAKFSASLGTATDPVTSITVPEKSKKIVDASIKAAYRALRTASANKFIEIATDALITSNVGAFHPENPLSVGVTLMAANTGTAVYAIPVESDDEAGYLKALSILESKEVYNVAVLTQSLTIQGYLKTHVDAMSLPSKGKWRVAWGNLAEPSEAVTPATAGASLILTVTLPGGVPTGTAYIYDAKSDFSVSVNIGDYVKVISQSNVSVTLPSAGSQSSTNSLGQTEYFRVYKVLEKINSSKLKLEIVPYEGSDAIYTPVANSEVQAETATYITKFQVIKALTTSEKAQYIANIAASFSDRRYLYITNGTCIVSYQGSNYELPGYYIAAALAGLSAGTLPHQPLTNYPIAGLVGVRGGSEKYADTDQGVIAAGGGWLVVQDILDASLPYTWQQLTTSQGGIKEQEFSFTKNLDEISKALVINHRRFPGRNNNVPEARAAIESQAIAVLDGRKTRSYNSPLGGALGTQIITYTFGGVLADPVIKDLAYADITVELPLPLNTIVFRLIA